MCSCGRDLKMGVNVKHYLPDNTHFLFTSWWLRFSGSAHWRQWRSNEQDVARNEGCKEMGNGRRRWYVRCRRTRWEEETCRLAQRIIKGKNAVQKTVTQQSELPIDRVSHLFVSLVRIWARAGQTVLRSLVLTVLFHRLLRLILDWQQADIIDPVTLKGFLGGWLGAHVPSNNSVIYPWKWRQHIWSVPIEILSDILTKDRCMAPISIVWRLHSVQVSD